MTSVTSVREDLFKHFFMFSHKNMPSREEPSSSPEFSGRFLDDFIVILTEEAMAKDVKAVKMGF